METKDRTGYLIIGAISAIVIAYFIGVSNGKGALSEQRYTDNDYLEMKKCYEVLKQTRAEVWRQTEYLGYAPTYSELKTARDEIDSLVSGEMIGGKGFDCY